MLSVWARRQGLLLSVCAKPTLYASFFFSGGTWPKAGTIVSPAAPTLPISTCLRLISIEFPPHEDRALARSDGFLTVRFRGRRRKFRRFKPRVAAMIIFR